MRRQSPPQKLTTELMEWTVAHVIATNWKANKANKNRGCRRSFKSRKHTCGSSTAAPSRTATNLGTVKAFPILVQKNRVSPAIDAHKETKRNSAARGAVPPAQAFDGSFLLLVRSLIAVVRRRRYEHFAILGTLSFTRENGPIV